MNGLGAIIFPPVHNPKEGRISERTLVTSKKFNNTKGLTDTCMTGTRVADGLPIRDRRRLIKDL